jgi:hypothetical protein
MAASTRLNVTLYTHCPPCTTNGFTNSTEYSPSYEANSRKKQQTPPPLFLKPQVSLISVNNSMQKYKNIISFNVLKKSQYNIKLNVGGI